MANPFGYGEFLGFSRDQLGETGLFPTQWVEEALRLASAGVYFPGVTPFQRELERGNGDSIVVPLEGEMVDTSWPTLVEGTSITVGSFNMDAFSCIIQEAGRGVSIERLTKQYLVNGNYPGDAQRFTQKLANNFVASWENELRGLYLNGMFSIRSAADGSFSSVETSPGAVDGTITTGALDVALDTFRTVQTGTLGTFSIPPFDDGLYRCVGNWKTIRGLLSDSTWRDFQTRNQNEAARGLIFQELGPWNDFMIIMHNRMPDGTCILHGRNVAIQAFGGQFDDSDIPQDVMQQIEDPVPYQIRFEPNFRSDFHRTKAAAWYTVAGSAAALMNTGTACIRLTVDAS